MRDCFHLTADGSLDRQFLRVAAVYRLIERRKIGKARAVELLLARRVPHAKACVEQWAQTHHLRGMAA